MHVEGLTGPLKNILSSFSFYFSIPSKVHLLADRLPIVCHYFLTKAFLETCRGLIGLK